MSEENVEAMSQIMEEEGGVFLTEDKIKLIVEAYDMHIDNMREIESYAHIDRNQVCSKCIDLKKEIEDYEQRERIWSKSVKNKIVGAQSVYMDRDNKIKYDLVR